MKTISVILLAMLHISCTSKNTKKQEKDDQGDRRPQKESAILEFIGVASELPDRSQKANRPGIITTDGRRLLFRGDYDKFPTDTYGKTINVTGRLRIEHMVVAILDPATYGDFEPPQAVCVPPGTDIEKAGEYYVIENPRWRVTEEAQPQR